MPSVRAFVRTHRVLAFFALAYVLTWAPLPWGTFFTTGALFAALSADSMGGIAGSVGSIGAKAIAAGANAGLVHRLTLAAATTFDSMPFSSMLNVTMGFLGLSHKDVYKQIVVVQIGATSIATIIGMLIAMVIG